MLHDRVCASMARNSRYSPNAPSYFRLPQMEVRRRPGLFSHMARFLQAIGELFLMTLVLCLLLFIEQKCGHVAYIVAGLVIVLAIMSFVGYRIARKTGHL